MKKILVAFALAAFANSAFALIAGSKHDFVTNGYVTPAPISTCKFCHTPHNAPAAVAGAPLWIRGLTTPSAYYVSTSAGTNTAVSAAGTQTCLACHATGTAAAMGTTSAITNGNAILGTDLSNDHPVGNQTIITLGTTNGFQASITLGGASVATGTILECSGCHDVHNAATQAGTKLLKSYTGSDFCTACHYK
jgi:predicted CXXCH cytochrome family protein